MPAAYDAHVPAIRFRPVVVAWGASLALAGLLVGCGERKAPPAARPSEASAIADVTKAREAAEAGDDVEVVRRLEAAEEADGEPGQTATTWRLSLALEAGDLAAARVRLQRLLDRHGGVGRDDRGRTFQATTLAAAFVETAVERARRAMEGSKPDPARARSSLEAALWAIGKSDPEEADLGRSVRRATTYLGLSDAPFDPHARAPAVEAGEGARVLVISDEFSLGDDILSSVLRRWTKTTPVGVVGLRTGRVRAGIRRAEVSPEEEDAAIAKAVENIGAKRAGLISRGSEEAEALGLDDADTFVFVIGADGRIAARLSGRGIDPRELDAVVGSAPPK